ncbi:unnamed protein product [Protopolystoma xenopodis]|uniref:Uncharacterized protein n=1 Tax=Protopolystoma xenopodis TaxID=117903 RepID=A0A448XRU1_9PLAT|nr:unnamed protein product [Protopolystoma xenopodis]
MTNLQTEFMHSASPLVKTSFPSINCSNDLHFEEAKLITTLDNRPESATKKEIPTVLDESLRQNLPSHIVSVSTNCVTSCSASSLEESGCLRRNLSASNGHSSGEPEIIGQSQSAPNPAGFTIQAPGLIDADRHHMSVELAEAKARIRRLRVEMFFLCIFFHL